MAPELSRGTHLTQVALLTFAASCLLQTWRIGGSRYTAAALLWGFPFPGPWSLRGKTEGPQRLAPLRAGPTPIGGEEYYARRAREEGVPARSYYKIEEIDRRCRLFRPGMKVLDLGCYPGSWMLYASRKVGKEGRVLGIDTRKVDMVLPANAKARVEDAFAFRGNNMPMLDVVMSDMSPDIVGAKLFDEERSLVLCQLAVNIADTKVAEGGSLVLKLFEGPNLPRFFSQLKSRYVTTRRIRPQATRSQSREMYLVGLGKRRFASAAAPVTNFEMPRQEPPPPQRVHIPHSFDGW